MTPDHSTLLAKARALDHAGRRGEALDAYRELLGADPGQAEIWAEYAALLMVEGELSLARQACDQALRLEPGLYTAQVHGACVLMREGRLEEAEAAFRDLLDREPARAGVRILLSDCLAQGGDLAGARALLEGVLAVEPGHGPALDRRNTLLVRQGDWTELRKDMRRQLAPHAGAQAEYVESHLSLLFGDLPEGWRQFEARLRLPGRPLAARGFTQPRWEGRPFPGQTLLVNWEQGFGDTLMFLRYLPLVKALGGRVVVEVQPQLAELAATCPGVDEVVAHGQPLPPFDLQVPLLSLPWVFGTDLESIPATVPYLDIPEEVPDREAITQVLAASTGLTRVGVAWAGNPSQARDRKRSLPAAALAPLASLPGVAWHSFQFEALEAPPLPELVTLGPLLKGFANTAYALSGMDLVITVDTVLAHLAGALGIPTLLLLSFVPDWRWLLGRDDSPWYPSMRLYRQTAPGDWREVLERVARDLEG